MDLNHIKSVGIIGAGTMGQGIAQAIALSGYSVKIYDKDAGLLEKGLEIINQNIEKGISLKKVKAKDGKAAFERIVKIPDIEELKADIIIEAIVEQLDVKVKVLQEVEGVNTASCILASNTSSIPISQIARELKRPEKFLGIHFFNPAHIMPLVEVITGAHTSEETFTLGSSFISSLNKKPVMVKDSPGFIVNRVARHFYLESLKITEESIADFETVDKLMESTGFKMGPFALMDLIGIDTNFAVTSTMYEAFHQEARFRPSRLQKQKVMAGQLGRKSGKGFYDY